MTLEASGTQSATPGTEHTLTTLTVAKALQLIVDINALAAGERVEIKVKTKTLSGGTTRIAMTAIYSWLDSAIDPIVVCEPFLTDQEYIATLKQIGGSSRSFPWKVLSP